MNKYLTSTLVFCMACSGCASERFRVTVTDGDGLPVSNAVVSLGFSAGHIVFAPGRSYDYKARTDAHGKAEIIFNGRSSRFGWDVKADGYYRNGPHDETLNVEVTQVPPIFYTVTILEHEKERKVTLWKKKNPQPMIVHGVGYEEDEHRVPSKNGRYGFDIMKYDWLPPLGRGEIADFHYVRCFGDDVPDGVVGWLEFPEKCGMYTGKQTGCKNFPSTYGADTNAVYKSRITFIFDHSDDGKKGITYKDIVNEDEYGVLRTRVVCDARGNIIKANYSKVLGPFRFGDWCGKWVILTPCAVFNPRVNDPNLESDPEHSYDPKIKRPLLAP